MSQKVRAKFNCHYIQKREGGGVEVNMSAVVDGSEESESFSEYTPSGNLNIVIDKGEAQNLFKEGKDYYLDFSKAE
ncbi:hypothetical protein [uncultured Christiangramia sp.]|uniref:hypothetical protein n=1 Tax=uncultured Christiangramia sp. TaxID=503836 RepID=UPI00261E672B|nr:hypothetical protein [uncultured Christiangramia sp.]